MSNQATYIKELTTLVEASAPIIVTRTREPYKAIEAIHNYVRGYNKENRRRKASQDSLDINPPFAFGRWTCLDGWAVEKADEQILCQEDLILNKTKVTPDNMVDPVTALQALMGTLPKQVLDMGAKNLPESGVFVMNWLQPVLTSPKVQACLLEIADKFVANDKCLVLVLPESSDIPTELQDLVTFLDYEVPADEERIELIVELLNGYGYSQEEIDHMDLNALSASCAGMTTFEIGNSVSRALFEFQRDGVDANTELLARKTNHHKTEMVKRGDILEVMPMGNIADIGGLECLKEWIDERKDCFTQEARDFGVDTPKGIALAGPPGSGKSACGKAIGHVLGLPVIKFDISKCFAGIVGQSEARVRSALKQLAALAPAVVLVDEIDKAFDSNSGGGDSGVGKRVLGSILTFMQDNPTPLFWVLTMNETQGLPPELLRKGRLDEIFSVSVPNPEERLEIIKIHLRKRKQDPSKIKNLALAVEKTEGYVAAELEAAVKEAIVKSFNKKIDLTGDLIIEQLGTPLSIAFQEKFDRQRSWAENNARPASRVATPAQPSAVSLTSPTRRVRSLTTKG